MATRQRARTRAKDSDRTDTCQVLDSALSDGQLSMEEHRRRVATATTATTLGELAGLVSDLQTGNAPVKLPNLKRPVRIGGGGWGLKAAGAAVLVVFGIAIGWGLYSNSSSPFDFTTDPGAKPDGVAPVVLTPPRQLHSLGGLAGLLEQARKKFGDTMGYRLLVYPEYASWERPDPAEERGKLDYDYRGGWADPSTTTKDGDDVLVDLGAFDLKTVVGIMRGAPETLGIEPADVQSTYLIVDPAKDPTAPGGLSLSVYVSGKYSSGYLEMDGAGNLKRVNYRS